MNEKIRSQILDIRNSGAVNMFSVNEVQRLAFEKDYHECSAASKNRCLLQPYVKLK